MHDLLRFISARSGAAITNEIEKASIPVVLVTPVLPIAQIVRTHRVVLRNGIVHVTGPPNFFQHTTRLGDV